MGMIDAGMARTMGPQLANAMKDLWAKFEEIHKDLQRLIDIQNEMIKAQITTYQLLKVVAEKQKVEIPEPLVKMEIEED